MTPARTAVVLLSGGVDSATTLAVATRQGFTCHTIAFDYGQRHAVELAAARRVAHQFGAHHVVATIDPGVLTGSALTDPAVNVPHQPTGGVPVTYVPARNTIFLAYALGYAETIAAADLFIGCNADDYTGYPDCRPDYIAAFQRMARLATRTGGTTVHAPLIHLVKVDIIRLGRTLGVDYSLTHSCYDPDGTRPCRTCDACRTRAAGFTAAGIPDPALGGEA